MFPNGIEAIDNRYFVFSCMTNGGLVRVDTSTKLYNFIVSDSHSVTNTDIDGMHFNADFTILYAARFINRTILALSSNDNWVTSNLLFTFDGSCPEQYGTSSLSFDTQENLFVVCTILQSYGPYYLNFASDVDTTVTNGNSIYGTDSSVVIDDSNDDDGLDETALLVGVIVLSVLCVLLLGYFVFQHVKGGTKTEIEKSFTQTAKASESHYTRM